MDQTKNKIFWDNQASDYSKNTLTNKSADEEMKHVEETLKIYDIFKMSCLGAADGVREPIYMLNFLKEIRKTFPKNIFINDISDSMIEKAKEHIKNYSELNPNEITFQFLSKPIQNLNEGVFDNLGDLKNSVFVMGCYYFMYIKKALKIYKEEKERIGTEFTLKVLFLEEINHSHIEETNFKIQSGEEIRFNINNEDDYLPKIDLLLQTYWQKPEFYAFSIETDKNFISHYFSNKSLNFLLSTIFKTDVKTSLNFKNEEEFTFENASSKRYVVNTIQNVSSPDHLITMLNNVLGNIPSDFHVQVLKLISDLFY